MVSARRERWLFVGMSLLAAACGRVRYEPTERGVDGGPDGGDAGIVMVRPGVCGDSTVDADERCDDGNVVDGDGCSADCARVEACGDGVVSTGEACDDGNGMAGDGCENDCSLSCAEDATCDDAQLCNGVEVCDVAEHICEAGVPLADEADCGDGRVCRAGACALASCGNGAVDMGEDCEDGNVVDGDGCDNDCSFSCVAAADCDDGLTCNGAESCAEHRCAAGVVQPDLTECTGVSDSRRICVEGDCLLSRCGDGLTDAVMGEDCDDGNTAPGDGCDNDCSFSCTVASDCDDGEVCNGTERCELSTHRCARGPAPANGSPCPDGLCASGRCLMGIDAGTSDGGLSVPDSGTSCPAPPLPVGAALACFKQCSADGDCILAQSSCCCGCTQGGSVEAINAIHLEAWNARRASMCMVDCGGILCSDVYVCPPPPTCIAGQCTAGGVSKI